MPIAIWGWLVLAVVCLVVQAIAIVIEVTTKVSGTRRRAGAVADRAKWTCTASLLSMFAAVVIHLFVVALT